MKRLIALVVAIGAAVLALAGPAGAHVTVSGPGATSGGSDQLITFRVPVEKDVDTTAVSVLLPTSTPIASVEVAPVPGWTHVEKTAKLVKPIETDDGDITSAVSQVTWTAQSGQGLKPGEYGSFTILAGQLPEAKSLTFKALQTYADGSVVRWIETQAPGSSTEPEHPAPTLELAAASGSEQSASSVPSAAPTVSAKPAASSSNTGPTVLAIVALVVAAAALGLAVVGRARRNQS